MSDRIDPIIDKELPEGRTVVLELGGTIPVKFNASDRAYGILVPRSPWTRFIGKDRFVFIPQGYLVDAVPKFGGWRISMRKA